MTYLEMRIRTARVLGAALVLLSDPSARGVRAEVTHVEITSRSDLLSGRPFGPAGPYEKLAGKASFALDPRNPHNQGIVDLDKAPRDAQGRVAFSADLYLLRPKEPGRGNGAVLFEVSNRGGKGLLSLFNHGSGSLDPSTEAEFGDGFLLRHGFTLAWVGWQFDVPRQPGLLRLDAPVATDNGRPITGLVRHDFVPFTRVEDWPLAHAALLSFFMEPAYPVLDPAGEENRLTVRETALGERRLIPPGEWQFARAVNGRLTSDPTRIALRGGFEPGKIYEVVYRARDPVVVGLGLAAVRDLVSSLKYQPDGLAPARRALGFGLSQSGRFLRHFLYQGFNVDERGRPVFDGLIVHVAAAGRGSFNHRFAQPSRDANAFGPFFYPTTLFPFTDVEQTDPETSEKDGLLTHALDPAARPRIFSINGSNEYYGKGASLIHTTVDGKADAPLMENVRLYFFAGSGHFPGPFPPALSPWPDLLGQQKLNPNDYSWSLRALLLALDRWVKDGAPPPPSRYPRIAGGTLVPVPAVAFPHLPGVTFPQHIYQPYRLDYGPQFRLGIGEIEPPRIGKPYPVLLPQVDADGNERAGIQMPEVAVPLATFTGWNLRDPKIGAPDELVSFVGSYLPFPRSRADRQRTGDPRRSIEERYQDRTHYLALVAAAARQLVSDGYLLTEDVPLLLARAAEHWDYTP